jgi:predicted dehydrogenase/threonine dehydrogenase-like Zn-dependent dehydrogenase
MKQVLIRSGKAVVEEVPSPQIEDKSLLVQVNNSCISVGTEISSVRVSALPLYRRALKQPDNVKKVLDMAASQGIQATLDRVTGKLAAGSPTGYSAAGVVVQVGSQVEGFSIGDKVACAGAGIANHAEQISVPVNLAVKVPDNISMEDASTVTLGSIAMQGVRRFNPTIGETVVVVGLGILGQITTQVLKANGCSVIVIDPDFSRCLLARKAGADAAIDLSKDSYIESVMRLTSGFGADGVIITAASPSNQIISDAMNACRKKGRVVIVGDIGLDLNRKDFYQKELDLLISSSYGPGRYDPVYEEGGNDYPLAYVRWTENRNMESYLGLLSNKKVDLSLLSRRTFDLDNAPQAYSSLASSDENSLLVFLNYANPGKEVSPRRVFLGDPLKANAYDIDRRKINVALVGASSFSQGVHLPNLVRLRTKFNLYAAMSRTGSNVKAVATQYSMNYCTTSYDEVLNDDLVDLVLISTRHNLHGKQVLAALQAGKNVFVEKPLALNEEELNDIEKFYACQTSDHPPLLLTGFNRRFAPVIQVIKHHVSDRTTPLMIDYQMNAGFIPTSHWVQGPEGGGRNLGEACHIYDLFVYLTGSDSVLSVSATSISASSRQWKSNDNFSAVIKFADGSICSLTYTSLGSKSFPKERMTVYTDGKVFSMVDYKDLSAYGVSGIDWSSKTPQKGHFEELISLYKSLCGEGPWPISLNSQLLASRLALEIEAQLSHKSISQQF